MRWKLINFREESSNLLSSQLQEVALGLERWASAIKRNRSVLSKKLKRCLEELDSQDRSSEVLSELMDVKLQLNFEVEKEERY